MRDERPVSSPLSRACIWMLRCCNYFLSLVVFSDRFQVIKMNETGTQWGTVAVLNAFDPQVCLCLKLLLFFYARTLRAINYRAMIKNSLRNFFQLHLYLLNTSLWTYNRLYFADFKYNCTKCVFWRKAPGAPSLNVSSVPFQRVVLE